MQYPNKPIINRKAKFEYSILEEYECGIILTGTEVKSLRLGRASISESYAVEKKGEIWLLNSNISPYQFSNQKLNHTPVRERKLLLKKKQIMKIVGSLQKDRSTIVPLKLFFNDKGIAKCIIGVAKGKQLHDKRQTIKERDWARDKRNLGIK